MRRFIPSPWMVVALIALVAAAAGTGVAATKKRKATQLIAKSSITGDLFRANTITGAKVKNNSIKGADVDEASLGKVPSAAAADAAAFATAAGSATTAGSADKAKAADSATTAGSAATADRLAITRGAPVKVAAPAADGGDPTIVTLGTFGPFVVEGRCVNNNDANTADRNDDDYQARLFVRATADNQVYSAGNNTNADLDAADPAERTGGYETSSDSASPAFEGVQYYNWLRLYNQDGTVLKRLDFEVGSRFQGADCYFVMLEYATDY